MTPRDAYEADRKLQPTYVPGGELRPAWEALSGAAKRSWSRRWNAKVKREKAAA